MTVSPYLNHFTQPDSIIPDLSNPQSWNRFGYVQNNPVNFSDPTGHCSLGGHWMPDDTSACEWGSSNQGSLSGNGNGSFVSNGDGKEPGKEPKSEDETENCIPSPGQWICDLDELVYEPEYCPITSTYVDCWEQNLPLYMGEEPMNIDPAQWDALLLAIRNDIHGMSKWELMAAALFYDTPFYDNSFYGLGKLPGTGCVDQQCYSRSELNYVAQGELWAATGKSIEETMTIVQVWKLLPIMHFPTVATGGTLIMTNIGYYDYKSYFPNGSP